MRMVKGDREQEKGEQIDSIVLPYADCVCVWGGGGGGHDSSVGRARDSW